MQDLALPVNLGADKEGCQQRSSNVVVSRDMIQPDRVWHKYVPDDVGLAMMSQTALPDYSEMMQSFIYSPTPGRVLFGKDKLHALLDEVSRQGLKAPLLLSGPTQAEQVEILKQGLGESNVAGVFTEATMHTPVKTTEKALEYAKSSQADSIVSIGGGSAIGLGKALSLRTKLPHICIPTTYAGSEMTSILGESADGEKKTMKDPQIFPGTVIYDVNLTMSLPVGLSITSGINAIAHSVEALYSENANPIISLFALEGVKCLSNSLPTILDSPFDLAARSEAQYGAFLCGLCLGSVGMGLHHKLCHTLGGSFNLPHSETHTIILAHALAFNSPAIPEVMKKLADSIPGSNGDAIHGLNVLLTRLGVKRGLRDFGFMEEDIDKAADIAVRAPYYNPREVERDLIRELIRRAYAGEDARADL